MRSLRPRPLRLFCASTLAAVVAATLLAATPLSASAHSRTAAGAFRVGTTGASWQDDPALAYLTTSWQLEYATCAKLLNYPDAEAPEGSRLRPEIAAAMPTV